MFCLNCCERKTLFRLKKQAEQAGFWVSQTGGSCGHSLLWYDSVMNLSSCGHSLLWYDSAFLDSLVVWCFLMKLVVCCESWYSVGAATDGNLTATVELNTRAC